MTTQPPGFGSDVNPVLPSQSPPPIQSDWYAIGSDGNRYGPMTIAQIIESVRHKRIGAATLLWHPVSSGSEWVSANQIALLAPYFELDKQSTIEPRLAVRPWQKRNSPRSSFRAVRNVVLPPVVAVILLFGFLWYTGTRIELGSLASLLQQPDDSTASLPPQQTHVVAPPTLVPPAEARTPERRTPSDADAFEQSSPIDRGNQGDGNLGRLLYEHSATKVTPKKSVPSEIVLLDFSRGKQIAELTSLANGSQVRVANASGFERTPEIEPSSGLIEVGAIVNVFPYKDRSISFSIRSIGKPDQCPKLLIDYATQLDWLGGAELSTDRLDRKRVVMMKQLSSLVQQRSVAGNELGTLTTYVNSRGAKPLDLVQQAQNRIAVLTPMVSTLDSGVTAQQSSIEQFDDFCRQLRDTFGHASLKIEVVSEVDQDATVTLDSE